MTRRTCSAAPVRHALAIFAAFLVALAVAAPHVHHAGPLGRNACQACVLRAGEEAGPSTPEVAPDAVRVEKPAAAPGLAPVFGLPLGAVPGQSPPRA